jgi:phage shock protein C
MSKEMKRLYRSRNESQIFGVCGGLGEYLEVDPTVIRLLWVVLAVATAIFPGLIAYLLAAIIVPLEPYAPAPQYQQYRAAPAGTPGPPPPGAGQETPPAQG